MLSGLAGLSETYTNHCIRHTTVNTLVEEGIEARHIMGTAGHKSESSIKSYAKKVSNKKRREISNLLANRLIEDDPRNKLVKVSNPKANITVSILTEDPAVVNAIQYVPKSN